MQLSTGIKIGAGAVVAGAGIVGLGDLSQAANSKNGVVSQAGDAVSGVTALGVAGLGALGMSKVSQYRDTIDKLGEVHKQVQQLVKTHGKEASVQLKKCYDEHSPGFLQSVKTALEDLKSEHPLK